MKFFLASLIITKTFRAINVLQFSKNFTATPRSLFGIQWQKVDLPGTPLQVRWMVHLFWFSFAYRHVQFSATLAKKRLGL